MVALHRGHPLPPIRAESTWEAQWANVTLFDRAAPQLRLVQLDGLTLAHPAVSDAAELFGMRVM